MRYISLLRGINVSGQKKMIMADLKALYESLGFDNVVTYIQSGNVIFDSTLKDSEKLANKIEKAVEGVYRFHVPVTIRSAQNLTNLIKSYPFQPVNISTEGAKILIVFLSAKPEKSKIDDLMKYAVEPEKLLVKNSEIYLYCPNGHGRSKLSNIFLEKKLGVSATIRNWKSLVKLHELSKN